MIYNPISILQHYSIQIHHTIILLLISIIILSLLFYINHKNLYILIHNYLLYPYLHLSSLHNHPVLINSIILISVHHSYYNLLFLYLNSQMYSLLSLNSSMALIFILKNHIPS
jgi:hypothetical protein